MRNGARRARIAAAALCALVAAAGCTRVDTATTTGLHSWTQRDRLRLASTEEPDSLNKLFANSDASDQVANLISAPVFRYDDRGEYSPEMATVVPTLANGGISRDGKTIVLHLHHGMLWSDGAPLDARDLRFTWHAVMNPRNNTRLRAGWDDIAAIDLPDNDTAIVHLREPYAAILGIFAIGGAGYPPLPEHLLAKLPDINHADFNEHPISSGPYVLTTWNHGSSLEFDANPKYWRGTPAIRAHLTYRIIPNADTLFAALQTHDIDVDVDSITETQIARVPLLTGYATQKRLVGNYRHITINTRKPLLSDVRVRLAIAEAVDWDRLNATVFHGYNARATATSCRVRGRRRRSRRIASISRMPSGSSRPPAGSRAPTACVAAPACRCSSRSRRRPRSPRTCRPKCRCSRELCAQATCQAKHPAFGSSMSSPKNNKLGSLSRPRRNTRLTA